MLPSAGLWPKTKVMISQAIHVLVSNIKQHVFAGIVNQYAALVHGVWTIICKVRPQLESDLKDPIVPPSPTQIIQQLDRYGIEDESELWQQALEKA